MEGIIKMNEQEKIEQMIDNDEQVIEKFEKGKKEYRYYSKSRPVTVQCEACRSTQNIQKLGTHYLCKTCYDRLMTRVRYEMEAEKSE